MARILRLQADYNCYSIWSGAVGCIRGTTIFGNGAINHFGRNAPLTHREFPCIWVWCIAPRCCANAPYG